MRPLKSTKQCGRRLLHEALVHMVTQRVALLRAPNRSRGLQGGGGERRRERRRRRRRALPASCLSGACAGAAGAFNDVKAIILKLLHPQATLCGHFARPDGPGQEAAGPHLGPAAHSGVIQALPCLQTLAAYNGPRCRRLGSMWRFWQLGLCSERLPQSSQSIATSHGEGARGGGSQSSHRLQGPRPTASKRSNGRLTHCTAVTTCDLDDSPSAAARRRRIAVGALSPAAADDDRHPQLTAAPCLTPHPQRRAHHHGRRCLRSRVSGRHEQGGTAGGACA